MMTMTMIISNRIDVSLVYKLTYVFSFNAATPVAFDSLHMLNCLKFLIFIASLAVPL